MEKKELLVMTSFGPVPFDVVKDYINPKVSEIIEKNKEKIIEKFEEEDLIPHDLRYYVEKLAKRRGWKVEKMDNFLNNLADINLCAAFTTVLREIAIELDKKYVDHIEKSEKIFCVSSTNGHIYEMDKKFIKNFRNFAAFRTIDDAKTACKITRGILKDMFKSGKRK